MKVLKFGGSSLATAERVHKVVEIVESATVDGPVAVVVSAFGGVTDDLIPQLAKMAVVDPTAPTNPVALTVANLEGLYARAINGELAA